MNRKKFIRNTALGLAATAATPILGKAKENTSTYDKLMHPIKQVGFNHLPNIEEKTMKTVLHKANTRGHANHGWLDSYHTFSFANYQNPARMHFGVLRVLNDDKVAASMGFREHPHDNMEIISIPLEGALRHKDSMGNEHVIKKGDVQVMSAGTGVRHSEFNKNKTEEVKFLQIWVFPRARNIEPNYSQITYDEKDRINKWQRVVSPENDGAVSINQDAYFSMTNLEKDKELSYDLQKSGNGIYLFILEGDVTVENQKLNKRDGFGLWETEKINLKASSNAEVLLMEVPMTVGETK